MLNSAPPRAVTAGNHVGALASIPIEERSGEEIRVIPGLDSANDLREVHILPPESPVANPAFDVTPAHLVSGLITEFGIYAASKEALQPLRERLSMDRHSD